MTPQQRRNTIQEEQIKNMKTGRTRDMCISICEGMIFLILIWTADPEDWGDHTRQLLRWAVILKCLVWPLFSAAILIIVLIKNSCFEISRVLSLVGWICIFYWHYYVLSKFFSSNNTCREESIILWIGHLYLVCTSILYFATMLLGFCLLLCILALVYNAEKKKKQDERKNINLMDMIGAASTFQMNPSNLQKGDSCCICLEEFNDDERIICLPWNKKHIYHYNWIKDWVAINSNCPLCKKQITVESIEEAQKNNVENSEEGKNAFKYQKFDDA